MFLKFEGLKMQIEPFRIDTLMQSYSLISFYKTHIESY